MVGTLNNAMLLMRELGLRELSEICFNTLSQEVERIYSTRHFDSKVSAFNRFVTFALVKDQCTYQLRRGQEEN